MARGNENVAYKDHVIVFPVQTKHWSWNPLAIGRIVWRAVVATLAALWGCGPNYISLEEFMSTCRTGDLLLMESDGVAAWAQTWWTGSTASHVAVVVVGEDDEVYIYESTFAEHGVVDVITNTEKSGPMMVRAQDRIHHYLLHVGFVIRHRPMWIADEPRDTAPKKTDANPRCRGDWTQIAFQMAAERSQVGFDSNVADLMAGSIPTIRMFFRSMGIFHFISRHGDGEFCAQVVAEFLMAVGAMYPARPPNRFAPKDFTYDAYNLPMKEGYGFHKPNWIFY
ncbi:MAG: hypothetical protein AB7P49_07170 [Bdellovibrionales bacterium]